MINTVNRLTGNEMLKVNSFVNHNTHVSFIALMIKYKMAKVPSLLIQYYFITLSFKLEHINHIVSACYIINLNQPCSMVL